VRRAALGALLALLALTTAGCETSAQKSARLEKAAKRHEEASVARAKLAEAALKITHQSRLIKVSSVTLLRSSEGDAVAITLRNTSKETLAAIPIAFTIRNAQGAPAYTNAMPGQNASLISVALLAAHSRLTWVDDQVSEAPPGASVHVKVGQGTAVHSSPPQLSIAAARTIEDPASGAGEEGEVLNHSKLTQRELVIFSVARRGPQIVAAGRAVVPSAPAGAGTRFQLFFIGSPKGAALETAAPPTTVE
jgi:hypothetical protein